MSIDRTRLLERLPTRRREMDEPSDDEERTNPFPGARPYRKTDGKAFRGRGAELRELSSLVRSQQLTLLYAPSGAGKTSLINAGLLNDLAAKTSDADVVQRSNVDVIGVAQVHPGAVRGPKGWPDEDKVPNVYVTAALNSIQADSRSEHTSLAEYFSAAEHPRDDFGDKIPRLLVLDQFEDILEPYGRRDWIAARTDFVDQLDEAMRKNRSLRVLIAIREDHLAAIERLLDRLTTQHRCRYRLDPFRESQARRAIEKPAASSGHPFSDDALREVIAQLSTTKIAGIEHPLPSEFINPGLLSVVSRRLWDKAEAQGMGTEIGIEHLEAIGGVAGALKNYYEDAVLAVSEEHRDEQRLRALFGESLISRSETRQLVVRESDESDTHGVPNKVLAKLATDYGIIRSERRGGTSYWELSHDGLIRPILEANIEARQRVLEARRRKTVRSARALAGVVIALLIVVLPNVVDPESDGPERITLGAQHRNQLDPGERDDLIFGAEAGDIVSIRFDELAENTEITDLTAPNEEPVVIGVSTRSGMPVTEASSVALPVTGDYALAVVNPGAMTASYEIMIEELVARPERPISLGGEEVGELAKGEVDRWVFPATAGEIVTARVESADPESATFVQLLSPSFRQIANESGSVGEETQVANVVLASEGQHTVIVSGSGSYSLFLDRVEVVDLGEGLVSGDLRAGEIEVAAFEADRGQIVSVTATPQGRDLNATLEIRDPANTLLASQPVADGIPGRATAVVTESGQHRVLLLGNTVGAYDLLLDHVDAADLELGEPQRIDAQSGQIDVFAPNAPAGSIVALRVTTDRDRDVHLGLLNGLGAPVTDGEAMGPSLAVSTVLPPSGVRAIVTAPFASRYEVEAVRVQPTTLVPDEPTRGALDTGESEAFYQFEGESGQQISLSVSALGDVDPILHLWGPDGRLLVFDDDGGDNVDSRIDRFEIGDSGTFTARASSYGDTSGEYEVLLTTH